MPVNDYFRCPACRAKLQFGRRPKARVKCPRCGHQFDYLATLEGSGPVGKHRDATGIPSAKTKEEVGATEAFQLALQEAAEGSPHSDAEVEIDSIDEGVVDEGGTRADDYGPAVGPIRPRKPAARVESEPPPTKQRPLSKRLKKWYKRSWLSNPSTGGWQIAAGYAGLGVIVLITLLGLWMRNLQSQA